MTPGSVADAQRLERLEDAVLHLRESAAGQIVVVEGDRDLAALERLGIGGEHRKVHVGRALEPWMDALVEEAGSRRVLLLLDWDRTGGRLCSRLEEGLRARLQVDTDCRRRLARASRSRCVEHLPSELAALRDAARSHAPWPAPRRRPPPSLGPL